MNIYKRAHPEELRIKESDKILTKYTTRIPVIVCKDQSCKLADIDKQKFLVPKDMTLAQFIYIIRKRIDLRSDEALFTLINNNLLTGSRLMEHVYDSEKDKDGFLYIVYTSENTFG